jgi:hypothetical protein
VRTGGAAAGWEGGGTRWRMQRWRRRRRRRQRRRRCWRLQLQRAHAFVPRSAARSSSPAGAGSVRPLSQPPRRCWRTSSCAACRPRRAWRRRCAASRPARGLTWWQRHLQRSGAWTVRFRRDARRGARARRGRRRGSNGGEGLAGGGGGAQLAQPHAAALHAEAHVHGGAGARRRPRKRRFEERAAAHRRRLRGLVRARRLPALGGGGAQRVKSRPGRIIESDAN